MFRKPDSTDRMWAHAIDLIEQAGHMHRQFFRLSSAQAQTIWEPPVDMFEDDLEVVIVVAMPGVVAERIEVTSAPGELVVRAERPLPFAAGRRAVRQLEIPYGRFERRIPLPDGQFEAVSHELSHGCLILRLRKTD